MTEEQKEEYFDNSEINQKLLKLYESKWDVVHKVCDAITNNDLWLVFHTLCIPPNYEKMKYKILIVGQENNGWGFTDDARLSMFDTLDFLDIHNMHDNMPFFDFPYKFCKSINNLENVKDSKKTYFAWVNLREFSFDEEPKTLLNEEAKSIINKEFNILEEQLKIIAPDIVLFLTGPNYDNYIRNQLIGVKFHKLENSEYEEREFARVEHKSLPKNSFRIYHPSYLRRRGLENEYLERLKKECGL